MPEPVLRGLRLSLFVCELPSVQVTEPRLFMTLARAQFESLEVTYSEIRSEAQPAQIRYHAPSCNAVHSRPHVCQVARCASQKNDIGCGFNRSPKLEK